MAPGGLCVVLAMTLAAAAGAAQLCTCGYECDLMLGFEALSGVDERNACNTISTSGPVLVENHAVATLRAGRSVAFGNDFFVSNLGQLVVEIDPLLSCRLEVDFDGDLVSECFDCDDTDEEIFPGADELCDGVDNDCDPATPDGLEDPLLGSACDGSDTDLCEEGGLICSAGSLACDDLTGDDTESCNGSDDDCDGQIDEDFNRNDNPVCGSGQFFVGSVPGDTSGTPVTDSHWNEEWLRVTVTEDNDLPVYLSATIALWSPEGVDYDLYVWCTGCSGGYVGSSTEGGLAGHWDTVQVRRDDTWETDDDFDVIVEVRHYASDVCAYWELTVTGDTPVGTATCN